MTKDIEGIRQSDTVRAAAQKMASLNVGVIPVLSDGEAVGVLTDRDITVRTVAEGQDPTQIKVKDIMSSDLVFCDEDSDLREAAQLMKEHKIRRLLVKDKQGKVVGILALGDIAVSKGGHEACEVLHQVSQPAEPRH